MEKNGEIRVGVTPPEKDDQQSKEAAAKDPATLQDHATKRLADAATDDPARK